MNIKLTQHAKQRCKERRISEKWVIANLMRIPLIQGTHEHLLNGTNVIVVFHDGIKNRSVITMYSVVDETPKEEPPKKPVDLKQVKPMLDKAKQKYIRRKNKNFKNKSIKKKMKRK